jgi:hypothetical protein
MSVRKWRYSTTEDDAYEGAQPSKWHGRGKWIGVGAAAVLVVGLGIGMASAQTSNTAAADPGTIVCPTVADQLPAVPAQSVDEVNRNLALLNTQVAEANNRLKTSVGQGGANFVNNAILGPLKDKRASTIDRIAISIGRHAAKPTNLGGLAACQLAAAGAAVSTEPTDVAAGDTGANAGNGANTGNNNGNAGATTAPPADNGNAGNTASPGKITCPSVADKLPAIPAEAKDESTATWRCSTRSSTRPTPGW